MTSAAHPEPYKNHRFPPELISHAVWLYFRFTLSYRDVEEMMFPISIRVSRRDAESIRELGRDYGYEADGLRAGSVDIEPQMRLLLSSDEISLNKLTKLSSALMRRLPPEASQPGETDVGLFAVPV